MTFYFDRNEIEWTKSVTILLPLGTHALSFQTKRRAVSEVF